MTIKDLNKIINANIGSILINSCEIFKSSFHLLEDQISKKGDNCLRDLIYNELKNVIDKENIDVCLWGNTKREMPEVSFKDVVFDEGFNSSHLPNHLGGTDIIISCDKDIIKKCELKSTKYINDNGKQQEICYYYLEKSSGHIFENETICFEVKVLHFDKKVRGTPCDESSYFLTHKHSTPSNKKLEFDENNPSTLCSGQILSDIARGAYILSHQNEDKNFNLMGVIVGEGDGTVKCNNKVVNNPRNVIINRIYDLIECIKCDLKYIETIINYIPAAKTYLDNTAINVEVLKLVKKDSKYFMYPYYIILTKKSST